MSKGVGGERQASGGLPAVARLAEQHAIAERVFV